MSIDLDALRERLTHLNDAELEKMAGLDAAEYTPEALQLAREELQRRGRSAPSMSPEEASAVKKETAIVASARTRARIVLWAAALVALVVALSATWTVVPALLSGLAGLPVLGSFFSWAGPKVAYAAYAGSFLLVYSLARRAADTYIVATFVELQCPKCCAPLILSAGGLQ